MELFALKRGEVARIDGIGVADVRWKGDQRDLFRQTISESMRLLREHDPRRYAIVKRYIKWIVNRVTNTMGGDYHYRTGICNLELPHIPGLDQNVLAAWFACMLVHEGTHGVIESRGIANTEDNCSRIERLCVAEQNRFAAKLAEFDPERYPARLLHFEFDEKYWRWEWTATPKQRRGAFLSLWLADMKAEPRAAPNGGHATCSGNSSVTEGPPSVS
jgi:hypothetical protein